MEIIIGQKRKALESKKQKEETQNLNVNFN